VLVSASGRRKTDYTSMTFAIWADSTQALVSVRDRLLAVVGDQRLLEETFTIDWHFSAGEMGLTSASFEEIADPAPPDEAYPNLGEPIARFVGRYLAARETVLILQGPPGTGKTRFVRAVLAAISRRKGDSAKVLYTADTRALESDEIFVEFATGSHDAFVIEDADHILDARANGNVHLHRFLAIADGVIRAQGRKILFTTNLPNAGDIDDALLRPGRCFANLRLRALDRTETERLLARLCGSESALFGRAVAAALPQGTRSATLASIYRAEGAVRAAAAEADPPAETTAAN
jgi:ATPase family associated with various cellular activities (AAA)